MNFLKFLKTYKILIIEGTQKGGIPIYNGSPKPIRPETPCDQINGYEVRFTNKYIITIRWDDISNNGIINFQLDEYYNNQWNRTLGVGSALPDSIQLNEIDGIEATLTYSCNHFIFSRDRDSSIIEPYVQKPLQMFSSDGKRITMKERNGILKCEKDVSNEKKNLNNS